jgi:hypothetical protein
VLHQELFCTQIQDGEQELQDTLTGTLGLQQFTSHRDQHIIIQQSGSMLKFGRCKRMGNLPRFISSLDAASAMILGRSSGVWLRGYSGTCWKIMFHRPFPFPCKDRTAVKNREFTVHAVL